MIALTSEQDKAQLKEHALSLIKQNHSKSSFQGLYILIEVLKETNFEISYSLKEKALLWASSKGYLEIIKYLVHRGTDIHVLEESPLIYATIYGYLDVVKYFVEQGADIHAEDDEALRWSAKNGHLNIVKYLVEQGADIHAKNYRAFRMATEYGHTEIVDYLKEVLNNDSSHQ